MQLGKLILTAKARIAVAISDKEDNHNIMAQRPDALELRVDLFMRHDVDYVRQHIVRVRRTGLPLILTIRNDKAEGGQGHIANEDKLKIFQSVIKLVDAVDIELSSPLLKDVITLARRHKKRSIVSWHNFQRTPPDAVLKTALLKAKSRGGDIVKIAAKAKSLKDVARLMAFTYTNRKYHLITMSLGATGSISRLAFPMAGSLLTYSYIHKPTAPGQVPVKALREDLKRYGL